MSDSLQHHELQHTRLPCPLLASGVCSDYCLLSPWYHPTISSSIVPFSSCLSLSQHEGLYQWDGPSHQMPKNQSFSFSISPSSEYLALISFRIVLFSLLSKGVSSIFCSTIIQKHQFFSAQPPLWSNSYIHNDYWKNHSFDYMDLCWQSDVSFLICCLGLSYLFFQGASILILWLQSRHWFWSPRKQNLLLFLLLPHLFAMKGWDQMPKTIWLFFSLWLVRSPIRCLIPRLHEMLSM